MTRGQARNGQPVAIVETIKRRELIIDCNPAALSGGVKPGMPATASLGLLDTLQLMERDTGAEQRALQRLTVRYVACARDRNQQDSVYLHPQDIARNEEVR